MPGRVPMAGRPDAQSQPDHNVDESAEAEVQAE
jgi:hypothetical protein